MEERAARDGTERTEQIRIDATMTVLNILWSWPPIALWVCALGNAFNVLRLGMDG